MDNVKALLKQISKIELELNGVNYVLSIDDIYNPEDIKLNEELYDKYTLISMLVVVARNQLREAEFELDVTAAEKDAEVRSTTFKVKEAEVEAQIRISPEWQAARRKVIGFKRMVDMLETILDCYRRAIDIGIGSLVKEVAVDEKKILGLVAKGRKGE